MTAFNLQEVQLAKSLVRSQIFVWQDMPDGMHSNAMVGMLQRMFDKLEIQQAEAEAFHEATTTTPMHDFVRQLMTRIKGDWVVTYGGDDDEEQADVYREYSPQVVADLRACECSWLYLTRGVDHKSGYVMFTPFEGSDFVCDYTVNFEDIIRDIEE